MKRAWSDTKEFFGGFTLWFGLLLALISWLWAIGSPGIIYGILGGILPQMELSEEIQLFPMGRWLFLIAGYLLLVSYKMEQIQSIHLFSLYRYKSYNSWWYYYYFISICKGMLLVLGTYLPWFMLEVLTGNKSDDIGMIMLTFALHMCTLISILTVFDRISHKKAGVLVLILAEGITYILSLDGGGIFGAWGMYVRSANKWASGYPLFAAYAIQIIVMVVCVALIPVLWKKELRMGEGNC